MGTEAQDPSNRRLGYSPLWKSHDAPLLQLLQHGQAGLDLQLAPGVLPTQVLANSKCQLLPAKVSERLNRLLNSIQLLPGKPPPAKTRPWQALDRLHLV